MDLEDLVAGIDNFPAWTHADRIRLFAWFIHTEESKERFIPSDIRRCYDKLALAPPTSVHPFLSQMHNRKPKEVLKDSRGYALERSVKEGLNERFGRRLATVKADKALTELPSKIPGLAERGFLDETISCFRCGAFRATIVMAWCLAHDHLCTYIYKEPARLNAFNTQLPKSYPNGKLKSIRHIDDFGELKEFDVLQVSRSAGLITNDLFKVLKEKLDKRNTAAHPSDIEIAPHTAEEFVIDLITNGVLKLV